MGGSFACESPLVVTSSSSTELFFFPFFFAYVIIDYYLCHRKCCVMNKSLEQNFEALYRAKYRLLLYKAFDLVEDEEIARDIVSEVFSQLWERFDQINEDQVVSYLIKAVTNRSIGYLRHERIVQLYNEENPTKECDEEKRSDFLEEKLDYLDSLLDQLPTKKRLIFELCCFEGKKYKEVADLLDMNVATVHKYMVAVYAFLREEFAKKYKLV